MSEAKHTPGPWISTPSGPVMQGYSQPFAIGQSERPNLVCGCFGDVRGGEEVASANARLIAVAPDMLAALKETASLFNGGENHGSPEHKMVCSAIAKAEGLS